MKKIFAKLHLWLSIPFGIVISLLCLTGALLVFESEIQEICHPSRYKASMALENPLPMEELMPIVKQQLPDSISISSVSIPADKDKNYRMGVTGQGRTSLLVDPYTGEIKGKVVPYQKGTFFSFVRRLHRWFLFEFNRGSEGINWGKMITGTSTLVFVFVLISGLVIWVPNTIKSLKRKLSVKTGKGSFRFWYDTHLATGMYALIFLLTMSLTGLTWSFGWYRTGFYKVFGVETSQNVGGQNPQPAQPVAANPHQGQPQQGEARGERVAGEDRPHEVREHRERTSGEGRPEDASGRRGGRPEGEDRSEGKPERGERAEGSARPENNSQKEEGIEGKRGSQQGAGQRSEGDARDGQGRSSHEGGSRGGRNTQIDYVQWTKVVAGLQQSLSSYKSISVQNGAATVSINRTGNTRASDHYTFDARTGEITDVQYYKDLDKSAKIRGWIYSVHVGSWGGLFTRILYFIACLIGAVLPWTGYYIFLKKRWKKWRKKAEVQTA